MRRQPLIIGAGPAGTAAAITLARAGRQPILIERSAAPAEKVCGDFLSADTILRARALGVDPARLGAAPIQRVRVIHRDRIAESVLPFSAMGLSRRVLDAALFAQAEAAGAVVELGLTVTHLTRSAEAWTARFADREAIETETVFLATGKHDVRDLPRSGTDHGAVGMKMYFRLRADAAAVLDGATELTLFPGGYAGLQPVEDGRAVLCIAVQRRAFQKVGASWSALLGAIGVGSERFGAILMGAEPLLPRPLAVAGIPYGYRAEVGRDDGLFRVGDQAAVIPSLTGDGMAIALHSGHAAALAWLGGAGSAAYHHALNHTLARQMRVAGLLHHVGMKGSAQAVALLAMRLFPALLRQAAEQTRLRDAAPG